VNDLDPYEVPDASGKTLFYPPPPDLRPRPARMSGAMWLCLRPDLGAAHSAHNVSRETGRIR